MNLLGRLVPIWLVALVCFTAGLGAGGKAMQVWYKGDIADLKLAAAESAAAGAATLAAETAKVRSREAEIADLNLKLEAQSAEDKTKIAAADGRVGDLLSRVRIAERAARGCRANSPPAGAAVDSEPAAGSFDRLSDALDDDHRECVRAANVLASYARNCHAFAVNNCATP